MKNLLLLSKKISLLMKLRTKEKLLLLEALFLTGIFRAMILVIPFKKLRKFMGDYNKEYFMELNEYEYRAIFQVRWVVLLVSKYTPWESKCLVQALTAQKMLKRRSIKSTIYFGIGRDIDKSILAHAWLKCGGITVTGESTDGFFKELARFS